VELLSEAQGLVGLRDRPRLRDVHGNYHARRAEAQQHLPRAGLGQGRKRDDARAVCIVFARDVGYRPLDAVRPERVRRWQHDHLACAEHGWCSELPALGWPCATLHCRAIGVDRDVRRERHVAAVEAMQLLVSDADVRGDRVDGQPHRQAVLQPERDVAICDLHHDAEHLQRTSYT
jgi:hypothetical protein